MKNPLSWLCINTHGGPWIILKNEHDQPAISSCFKGGGDPTIPCRLQPQRMGQTMEYPLWQGIDTFCWGAYQPIKWPAKRHRKIHKWRARWVDYWWVPASQWLSVTRQLHFPVTLLGTWLLLDCHVAGIGTPLEPHSYDLQPICSPDLQKSCRKMVSAAHSWRLLPLWSLWSLCWLMKLISSWGWNMVKIDIVFLYLFHIRLVFGFQKSWISLSGWRNHHTFRVAMGKSCRSHGVSCSQNCQSWSGWEGNHW